MRQQVFADIKGFANGSDDILVMVENLNIDDRLGFAAILRFVTDAFDELSIQMEFAPDASAAGFAEVDGGGFVPDHIACTEVLFHHQAVDGIGHGK